MSKTNKALLAQSEKLLAAATKARKEKAAKASLAAKTKVKADDNGGFGGEGGLEPAPEPDMTDRDVWGVSPPPDLVDSIEEGKDKEPNMGIQLPPGFADVMAAIADPADLNDADLSVDLVPFIPEEAKSVQDVLEANAKWVVFANSVPFAEIRLNDQDHKARIAGHFVSASFARDVNEAIQKNGLAATMKDVKARFYIAKLDATKRAQEIKASLEKNAEEALRQQTAGLKKTFDENLDLAIEATATNFTVENPLKDDLIKRFTAFGMDEAEVAREVDASYAQHGSTTLRATLDKAEEWSGTHPEAMKQIRATMEKIGHRHRPLPSQQTPAQRNPNYDAGYAQRLAANAVPVAVPVSASHAAEPRQDTRTPVSPGGGFRERFGAVGRRTKG